MSVGSNWFSFKLEKEFKTEVFNEIVDNATFSPRYVILLTLSTIIAACGLLANSTAAVIGAMIIAPLMGPIMGSAMGLTTASHSLTRKSLLAEFFGVLIVIAIGFLIASLPVGLLVTPEVLARTTPTLLDLGVALASGLAGAYGFVNPKVSPALAGVAISVSLVPPLAACGILLAMGMPKESGGAFLLFFTNFLAIQLAASVVFSIFGFSKFRRNADATTKQVLLRFAPSIVAFAVVAVFLTNSLLNLTAQQWFDLKLRRTLAEQIASSSGGQLSDILTSNTRDRVEVIASAFTPRELSREQVKQIQDALRSNVSDRIDLIVRSLIAEDIGPEGRVYLPGPFESVGDNQETREVLTQANEIANEFFRENIEIEISNVRRLNYGDKRWLKLEVHSPRPIQPAEVAEIEKLVRERIDPDLNVVVRSIATRDATSDSFLFVRAEDAGIERADLLDDIEAFVGDRFPLSPRQRLVESSVREQANGVYLVLAVVESPEPVNPEVVNQVSQALRDRFGKDVILKVQTELVATSTQSP
ncbi:MAG: TIGR00341 family protein [Fimbriimonadaceae bacterium]